MRRGLTVLMVIVAAIVCAGCQVGDRFRLVWKRHEVRMIMIDWGVTPER